MKIILSQSKIVINKTPEVVWEREGDYAKFSADGTDQSNYYGYCQYTRLMSADTVFDGVIFGFLKAPSAMDVNYRVFMTDYLASNKNEAPELYDYPNARIYTEISNGTVHIGTDYSDIVIQVPETTVPVGKEVVCMIYGNGTDKLTIKAGGGSEWTNYNNAISNSNRTMLGTGLWIIGGTEYSGGASMSLRLIKSVD